MKTYKLELRHAPSKNKLNAVKNNRLAPFTGRFDSDDDARAWGQSAILDFARKNDGKGWRYFEAALLELLPLTANSDKDSRRLGRWVLSHEGLHWRASTVDADQALAG